MYLIPTRGRDSRLGNDHENRVTTASLVAAIYLSEVHRPPHREPPHWWQRFGLLPVKRSMRAKPTSERLHSEDNFLHQGSHRRQTELSYKDNRDHELNRGVFVITLRICISVLVYFHLCTGQLLPRFGHSKRELVNVRRGERQHVQ